jgi:prepilin-type processing-associated H-X9-DG protein
MNPLAKPWSARLAPKHQRAFTRIEMLLVLCALTLLVCLFWPRDSAAQARARTATCRSQMHRLVLALRMYTDDYDGFFPCDENWDRALVNRLHVPTPFACPELRLSAMEPPPSPYPPSRLVPGYALNSRLVPLQPRLVPHPRRVPAEGPGIPDRVILFPAGDWSRTQPVHLSEVRYPSLTVAFCETRSHYRFASQPDSAWKRSEVLQVGGRRHQSGANYAFIDGSVKWYLPEDVTGHDPRFPPDGITPNFQLR